MRALLSEHGTAPTPKHALEWAKVQCSRDHAPIWVPAAPLPACHARLQLTRSLGTPTRSHGCRQTQPARSAARSRPQHPVCACHTAGPPRAAAPVEAQAHPGHLSAKSRPCLCRRPDAAPGLLEEEGAGAAGVRGAHRRRRHHRPRRQGPLPLPMSNFHFRASCAQRLRMHSWVLPASRSLLLHLTLPSSRC